MLAAVLVLKFVGLAILALAVLALLGFVLYEMATDPVMWLYYTICGTPGALFEVLIGLGEAIVAVGGAIVEAIGSSLGGLGGGD